MNFSINKKLKSFRLLFLAITFFAVCLGAQTYSAAAKEYYYKDFEVDIKINKDSTFDVTEKQTYFLDGSFGFFNRDVSLNKIDAITDIKVFNGKNNKIPKSELEIKSRNGKEHIQWNFPRRDFNEEEKSWIVKYKVHGGISFLKNYDEIYWNAIPSRRSVPIKNVKVTVSLPNNEKFKDDLIQLYSEQTLPKNYYFKNNNTQAVFNGKNLKPNTNFTIAAGFSKNIVSQSAYWKDFFKIYYGYILSIIIFLSCVIIGFVHWYKTEKSREGKRAIVPRYEPPQDLRPAMAEVIVKEELTDKGLAATIIDLAVRGYVKIEEEKKAKLEVAMGYLIKLIPTIMLIVICASMFSMINSPLYSSKNVDFFPYAILLLFLIIMFIRIFFTLFKNKKASDYKIIKIKPYENDSGLEDYEKEYLKALFDFGESFSTKELKRNQTKARALYIKIQKVKYKIYEETELDTKAFKVGLTIEKRKKLIWSVLSLVVFFMVFMGGVVIIGNSQFLFLALTTIISVIGLYAFIKYEARLSDQGIKLKENWLGFKMYLETAERYRMQNLKPEFFEKYLPYAMIFGVEKKWAKAFESMHIPQPSWYAGSAYAVGVSSSSNLASSFSPSAFSASFTSSFTSAFSSSGASGASAGGGGAGGGGGGGGGGAG